MAGAWQQTRARRTRPVPGTGLGRCGGVTETDSHSCRPRLGRGRQLHLAYGALDRLHLDLDRIPEPVRATEAAADEGGAEGVELEVVAFEAPGRHVALEGLPEADEQTRVDHP